VEEVGAESLIYKVPFASPAPNVITGVVLDNTNGAALDNVSVPVAPIVPGVGNVSGA